MMSFMSSSVSRGSGAVSSAPLALNESPVLVPEKEKKESKQLQHLQRGIVGVPRLLRPSKGSAAMNNSRLQVTPHLRQWFRFSTDQNCSPTVTDLFAICGGIVTVANTTVRNWAGSVRLRKIRIWCAATNTVAQSGLLWAESGTNGSRQPDFSYDQSQPTNMLVGQVQVYTPPKGSLAGFWFLPTYTPLTDKIFTVVVNGARVMIDVLMEFTLANTIAMSSLSIVTTHAAGTQGYAALDQTSGIHATPIALPNWT